MNVTSQCHIQLEYFVTFHTAVSANASSPIHPCVKAAGSRHTAPNAYGEGFGVDTQRCVGRGESKVTATTALGTASVSREPGGKVAVCDAEWKNLPDSTTLLNPG